MNELLIDRLKTARITNGLKQQDVAEQMGIKANTISNWEKGRTEPDIDSFVKLCDIYKIDCASLLSDVYAFQRVGTDISLPEYDHIKKYRLISEKDTDGKTLVDSTINYLCNQIEAKVSLLKELQTQNTVCSITVAPAPTRFITYYQKLASAGTGEYLFDSVPTDTMQVPLNKVSEQADFVIGVNGHSMEPTYSDGDKVYVKITDEIPTGSIGLFTKGNDCFIKELGVNCLISHNHADGYEDIPAREDIKLVGEVLGKVEED